MARLGNVEHLRTERHALLADPRHVPGVALALIGDETGKHEGSRNHTFNAVCNVAVSGLESVEVSERTLDLLGIEGDPGEWTPDSLALGLIDSEGRQWHGQREALGYQGEYLVGEALLRAAGPSVAVPVLAGRAIRRRAAYAALMEVRGAPEVTCLTLGCRVGDAHDGVLSRLRMLALGEQPIPGLKQPWAEGVKMISELTGYRRVPLTRLETIAEIVEELRATGLRLHPDRAIGWWGSEDRSWWCAEMASLDGCVQEKKEGVSLLKATDGKWEAPLIVKGPGGADWHLRIGPAGVEVLRSPAGVAVEEPAPPPAPEPVEPEPPAEEPSPPVPTIDPASLTARDWNALPGPDKRTALQAIFAVAEHDGPERIVRVRDRLAASIAANREKKKRAKPS